MSDLSKCKVGDNIATVQYGWEKITNICHDEEYIILYIKNISKIFHYNGFSSNEDKHPTAFTEEDCPSWLLEIIGPPPCKFKKGDRVICNGNRRYFSHEEDGLYYCFYNGRDEWTSGGGETNGWYKTEVKKWERSNNL